MDITKYIDLYYAELPISKDLEFPWDVTENLIRIIGKQLQKLSKKEFNIENRVAIHKTAIVENNVTLKDYCIICENCVIKSGSYLRDGVYLGKEVVIGTNCEIKQSIIFPRSRISHLNYVGNSIVGEDVNLEAGAVLANHLNEFKDQTIKVIIDESIMDTHVLKFGSLIGDGSRIGANSVLNPGTILIRKTIVGRLKHIDQMG